MATRHLTSGRGFFGEIWRSWPILALAVIWCSIFYILRQPPTPFAFDLPQAQTNSRLPGDSAMHDSAWAIANGWLSAYPTTLFNCGNGGGVGCSNYCDQNSLVRYTDCNAQ